MDQPPGFEDSEYPNHVYRLSKALYELKQAPRAWYECLRDFLIANGFKVGKADPTLFTKTLANDLFVCQIYPSPITGIETAFTTFSNSVNGSFPLVYSVYPTNVVPTISNPTL